MAQVQAAQVQPTQLAIQEAGTVVPFRPASRRPRRTDSAVAGTVLLFTGVRYERRPDPVVPGGAGHGPERGATLS